jgi:CheY-like chemotaxis protein
MAAVSNLVRSNATLNGEGSSVPPAPPPEQASKLETMGRLASGVAHDFANILTLISGYTEILLAHNSTGEGREELGEIRRAANRGATLVSQLLSFVRNQPSEPQAVALNHVVSEVERMLRPLIGEAIQVQLRLAPVLAKVLADPVQLDQVLMNLLLNARDAMPNGGTILIATREEELDAQQAAALEMKAGPCITLTITDTGEGIDEDAMLRLFDPFFSTKPRGKGAGLGLSTVREIVRRYGGAVWAASVRGAGATFSVCLPKLCEAPEIRETNPARLPASGGSEAVLVVEDEESVRRLLVQVLRTRGYQVLEACDGEAALALFAERGNAIQLVLTDVIMPKMSGTDLARRLLGLRPDLPMVLMSGYPDDHLSGAGGLPAGLRFLRKPLLPEALATAVRESLDSVNRPFNPQ